MLLRLVVNPYLFPQEYAVVRLITDDDATLTVMHMALIQDCLTGADRESLKSACSRPGWTVASDEFYVCHCFTCSGESWVALAWKLQAGNSGSQIEFTGLLQYITQRRHCSVPDPAVISVAGRPPPSG
jgi:hypothetical protein